MLDFRLQTFLAVCRTLSYTRAAEELSLTQPAVSQHVAALEKRYGTKLFSYRNKKLALTPAGEVLRACAAGVEHEAQLLKRNLELLHEGREPLRVGVTLTAGEYVLAAPLARWLAAHPHVDARIVQGDTARLLGLLERGAIDFALIEGFFDKQAFSWSVFCRQRLACVCAPGCALAEGAPLRIDELLDQHLLTREEGSGTRAVLEHALAARNLAVGGFARVTEVESLNIIKTLAAEGLGIAFLYEAAVLGDVRAGHLALVPLDEPPIEHDFTFVCQKGGVLRERFRTLFGELEHLAESENGAR